jgi:two-component sensor histidine kinase
MDDAILLTCELVTNVIRHVQSSMTVTIALENRRVRITVSDDSREPPRPRSRVRPWDASGWGLQLIDAVATAWGVQPAVGGKAVWFELAA